MSDVTGNPRIVHTFGATPEALVKYLEFVGDAIDAPFMIDSTSGEAKIAGAKYASEAGLAERAIYNSINMAAEADEIDALKELILSASIVLGFNPMEPGVEGKINMWENGGSVLDKGLLEMSEDMWNYQTIHGCSYYSTRSRCRCCSKNFLCC